MSRYRPAVGCWIAPAALWNVGGCLDRVNRLGAWVFAALSLFSRSPGSPILSHPIRGAAAGSMERVRIARAGVGAEPALERAK